jgi:hypothetical protein
MKSNYITLPVLRGSKEIEILWPLVQEYNVHVCGGYARYCLSQSKNPIPAGDIDLFPQDEKLHKALIDHIVRIGFSVKNENELAVTFGDYLSEKQRKDAELEELEELDLKFYEYNPKYIAVPRIQVIKPIKEGNMITTGNLIDILDRFDFTITRVALTSLNEGIADENFVEHDISRKLEIKHIHCPISSIQRVVKYSNKGYWLSPQESVKLFTDWDGRDDDYKNKVLGLVKKLDDENLTKEEVVESERLFNVD